jgi:hypothetical protein
LLLGLGDRGKGGNAGEQHETDRKTHELETPSLALVPHDNDGEQALQKEPPDYSDGPSLSLLSTLKISRRVLPA